MTFRDNITHKQHGLIYRVLITRYVLIACIILIALFISSCSCTILKFGAAETFWTDIYSEGDTLLFATKTGAKQNQYDTLFITKKKSYEPKGECNYAVSHYDPQACILDYKYKHLGKPLSEYDYLVQHVKEPTAISLPVLRVYGLEYSGKSLQDTIVFLNILNRTLADCYVVHRIDCYYVGWSEYPIDLFVWSRSMGLVMVQGHDGKTLELAAKVGKGL